MTIIKRIVCLANSRKLAGRCIAGKVVDDAREWIRPVSGREHEEVSKGERQYENGSDPAVLDVIDVPVMEHRDGTYQSENWLLDDSYYWTKIRRLKWRHLAGYEDQPRPLWTNEHRTFHGLNDQIALDEANFLTDSLRLIQVPEITIRVFRPGAQFGNNKRRAQGSFEYIGDSYRLWITDAAIEDTYLRKDDGLYVRGTSYLAISLGEPYQGNVYKLIAAIITVPGGIE